MRKGYHDLKRPEILNLIPPTAKKIIDLGCGTGSLGKALKERQSCHITGIELDRNSADVACTNLDKVYQDNLNRYDPALVDQKYDCIILADILEHLVQPWQVLKKFAQVLEENGTVIASIPNIAHPWIISQLQKGLFRYELAGLLDVTHLRFFTKTTIGQLFYKAGLKTTKITAWPNERNPVQYHVTAKKPSLKFREASATILILSHNTWRYTKEAIERIKSNTVIPHKILVIDNGSTDGTIEHLREDNAIYHIENSHNIGFAAGFNVGLGVIDTPYFVICNSDVVVTQNWLKRMTEHLNEDPEKMSIGPRSNYVSGPQIVKGCTYKTANELIGFAKRFDSGNAAPTENFKRLVFFCTLFKSEVLRKVGYLDEIYEGGNYEDDDYCMRIIKKGFKCAIDNTVFVHHYGSQTFKQNKIDFAKTMNTNGQRFMRKWGFKNMEEYFNYLRT